MQNERGRQVPPALALLTAALALGGLLKASETTSTQWTGGVGLWTEASHWSDGLPDAYREVVVRGRSDLAVPAGDYFLGDLEVGCNRGDRARVEVDGGRLILLQDSLRLGEYSGSDAEFVLKDGALHCAMDVFVGAATATTNRMTKAALTIEGGSFVGRNLTVGEGLGADALVAINGSRTSAIAALEFVYLLAAADPSGQPGQTTLKFTLDEHGVTPITIPSRWDGLRIIHDHRSHCRLQIALSAIPPRDDVTLVASRVATRGTFDGLPEGAGVMADYGGRTYRWTLTYQGGTGGHNLVLRNASGHPSDAPATHVRSLPENPEPLWSNHPVYPLSLPAGPPAFPGAEGYGAFTPGGRGGREIFVDNLNDSGPGSLRSAVKAAGPRTVVFRVGGVIRLQSALSVEEPYLTIDASGAPGPGIMLRRHGIEVHTHDVVLRQFRIRIGDEDVRRNDQDVRYAAGDGDYALYFVEGSRNCIADHLSLSWSTNKILSTTKMADLISVQWCILSESLNLQGHGYASIAGGNRVSWHHNLFAHNNSRNARFQGAVDADFRNNVVYDWGIAAGYGEFDRLNYVGNFLKPGPSTKRPPLLFLEGEEAVMRGSLYLADNILLGSPEATRDNWRGSRFFFDRATLAAVQPFPAPSVVVGPAAAAYGRVLEQAGATLPRRDAVDQRVVREVKTGTGHIVDSVAAAGGWPDFR